MYTTQRYEAKVAVDHYIKEYVDVEGFLEACRACHNYNRLWSCPPYDFAPIAYWQRFKVLELTAVKIIFDKDYAGKPFEPQELERITREAIGTVKAQLTQELYEREKEIPGSVSLSAGSCSLCNLCSRPAGEPCRRALQARRGYALFHRIPGWKCRFDDGKNHGIGAGMDGRGQTAELLRAGMRTAALRDQTDKAVHGKAHL